MVVALIWMLLVGDRQMIDSWWVCSEYTAGLLLGLNPPHLRLLHKWMFSLPRLNSSYSLLLPMWIRSIFVFELVHFIHLQLSNFLICAVLSCSVMSDSLQPHAVLPGRKPHGLLACQAPLSMGILQARILEWVTMPSCRGSSRPRTWTQVFLHCKWILYCLSPGKYKPYIFRFKSTVFFLFVQHSLFSPLMPILD